MLFRLTSHTLAEAHNRHILTMILNNSSAEKKWVRPFKQLHQQLRIVPLPYILAHVFDDPAGVLLRSVLFCITPNKNTTTTIQWRAMRDLKTQLRLPRTKQKKNYGKVPTSIQQTHFNFRQQIKASMREIKNTQEVGDVHVKNGDNINTKIRYFKNSQTQFLSVHFHSTNREKTETDF